MVQFLIYTNSKIACPFCIRAKQVLSSNSFTFEERDISVPAIRSELLRMKPEAKTVPQIFFQNGNYLGDCNTLVSLVEKNALMGILEMHLVNEVVEEVKILEGE